MNFYWNFFGNLKFLNQHKNFTTWPPIGPQTLNIHTNDSLNLI